MKSRPRLNADGEADRSSTRCMHNVSFMALVFIVSEKMVQMRNSKICEVSEP